MNWTRNAEIVLVIIIFLIQISVAWQADDMNEINFNILPSWQSRHVCVSPILGDFVFDLNTRESCSDKDCACVKDILEKSHERLLGYAQHLAQWSETCGDYIEHAANAHNMFAMYCGYHLVTQVVVVVVTTYEDPGAQSRLKQCLHDKDCRTVMVHTVSTLSSQVLGIVISLGYGFESGRRFRSTQHHGERSWINGMDWRVFVFVYISSGLSSAYWDRLTHPILRRFGWTNVIQNRPKCVQDYLEWWFELVAAVWAGAELGAWAARRKERKQNAAPAGDFMA
ncbi:hypothetical protein AB5N19_11002 [Seiridium cardinale]|uniref:Uncharacterized protein n=1 Tax=Seiridium cardinale TaxID=138064 RepID=A0ABR2X8X4_9PEZI